MKEWKKFYYFMIKSKEKDYGKLAETAHSKGKLAPGYLKSVWEETYELD
jgi:hypothetical protein